MCDAVPLDPLLPDSLQQRVLEDRARGAGYIGADWHCFRLACECALLVADGRIIDTAARGRRTTAGGYRHRTGTAGSRGIQLAASRFDTGRRRSRAHPARRLRDDFDCVGATRDRGSFSRVPRTVRRLYRQPRGVDRAKCRTSDRSAALAGQPGTQDLRGFATSYARASEVLRELPTALPASSEQLRQMVAEEYFLGL